MSARLNRAVKGWLSSRSISYMRALLRRHSSLFKAKIFTNYSRDQLQELLSGEPDEPIVQQKFMDTGNMKTFVIKSLTRQQVKTLLGKVLKDEGLIRATLFAAQRGHDEFMNGAEEMSDEVIELYAEMSRRLFFHSEPDKVDLYRSLHPQLKTIVRDYMLHKY